MILISVQEEAFDPAACLAAFEGACGHDSGAVVSFTGRVRDVTDGQGVAALTLDHYPGMTEKQIEEIANQATTRWDLQNITIIHRFGTMTPGEAIVFIAVSAAHRGDAFSACEFLIDWVKTKAPFWKREDTPDGSRWVEAREEDDARAAGWAKGGR